MSGVIFGGRPALQPPLILRSLAEANAGRPPGMSRTAGQTKAIPA